MIATGPCIMTRVHQVRIPPPLSRPPGEPTKDHKPCPCPASNARTRAGLATFEGGSVRVRCRTREAFAQPLAIDRHERPTTYREVAHVPNRTKSCEPDGPGLDRAGPGAG